MKYLLSLLSLALLPTAIWAASPSQALIIDGQNNHAWQQTTPVLKKLLEETGLFHVDVLTSPPKGGDFSAFKPEFSKYQVIVSNFNGDSWPAAVKESFEQYMRAGGGLVSYHAADNAFPEWPAFNEMIGVGGWGDRDEKAGPNWYFKNGKLAPDETPFKAGSHGVRKPFLVAIRNPAHPITAGIPASWLHEADELYAKLRGPGQHINLLATAFSDPANRGTGRDEPMLMTIAYGKGRVFHTTLGHDTTAMQCVGFIVTLQRGAEWAATGKVTQKIPPDFPSPTKVSTRP